MIEDTYIHQGKGLFQPFCYAEIGLARLSNAGGMVVREDAGGSVLAQGGFDDLARMHVGTVDRAAEQFFKIQDAVPVIKPQYGENFMFEAGKLELRIVARFVWLGNNCSTAKTAL